jgi:transcriptional regulator GlxA family with amidase domain
MDELSPQAQRLQRKQNRETLAIQAGEERARIEGELTENTQWIIDLMPKALEAGIPLDTYAKLVGVSRQTLYRWRED